MQLCILGPWLGLGGVWSGNVTPMMQRIRCVARIIQCAQMTSQVELVDT